MKREFGDLAPFRALLADIERLERAPYLQPGARDFATDMRKQLASAIAEAEADIVEGLSAAEYAELHGITRAAAYKRAHRGTAKAHRKPGIGYVFAA